MSRTANDLWLMHRAVASDVLGPGRRAILWVAGCPHRCEGCIAPEGWDPRRGTLAPVLAVAEWVLAQTDIEGVTLSGGEPMMQAGALAEMLGAVRRRADLGVICYTGYVLPPRPRREPGTPLRRTAPRRRLLAEVDLLIDGPYVRERHADLLWRASDNQRLLDLTGRYAAWGGTRARAPDRSAGLVCELDAEGRPVVIGVPPRPGFRQELEGRVAELGIRLKPPR